jgi:hypothetical protein
MDGSILSKACMCVPCDYLYNKILYQRWSFLWTEAVGVRTAKCILRTGVAWLEDGWLVKFVHLMWV